jgi:hypothetical protein
MTQPVVAPSIFNPLAGLPVLGTLPQNIANAASSAANAVLAPYQSQISMAVRVGWVAVGVAVAGVTIAMLRAYQGKGDVDRLRSAAGRAGASAAKYGKYLA